MISANREKTPTTLLFYVVDKLFRFQSVFLDALCLTATRPTVTLLRCIEFTRYISGQRTLNILLENKVASDGKETTIFQ